MIKPVLLHNSETWGLFDVHSLEQICLKFYKSILKVPQTCTNAAVYSELGCLPISLDASKSVIKYYFRLLQQPVPVPNTLRDALKLFQDLSKARLPSWYFKLERSLLSLGFDPSFIGEHVSYDTIATRLQDHAAHTAAILPYPKQDRSLHAVLGAIN